MLILPGDPLFDLTLGVCLPPTTPGREAIFIARSGSGILEAVSSEVFEDYLFGGEYDERIGEIEDE